MQKNGSADEEQLVVSEHRSLAMFVFRNEDVKPSDYDHGEFIGNYLIEFDTAVRRTRCSNLTVIISATLLFVRVLIMMVVKNKGYSLSMILYSAIHFSNSRTYELYASWQPSAFTALRGL